MGFSSNFKEIPPWGFKQTFLRHLGHGVTSLLIYFHGGEENETTSLYANPIFQGQLTQIKLLG
jgi:hypothetical protein